MEAIVKYLQTNDIKQCNVVMLSAYIAWYDIPTPEEISKIIVEGRLKSQKFFEKYNHICYFTIK